MYSAPQGECEKPTCPPGYKVVQKKIRRPNKYTSRYAEYRYGQRDGNSGVKGTKGGNFGVKGGIKGGKGGNRGVKGDNRGVKGGNSDYRQENDKE